jgi:hypothetical protein
MNALTYLGGQPPPRKLFVVTFDLHQEGQRYAALGKALIDLEGLWIQQSTWWVAGYFTEIQLREHLFQFMDGNDSLMVGQLSSVCGYESNPKVRAWIGQYLAHMKLAA